MNTQITSCNGVLCHYSKSESVDKEIPKKKDLWKESAGTHLYPGRLHVQSN